MAGTDPKKPEGPASDPLPREVTVPPPEAEAAPPARPDEGSPLHDYLLELEKEFQDQEDEGKLGAD